MDDIYVDRGYASRSDYLDQLAAEHNVNPGEVHLLASLLGPNEDFDGLVAAVEDLEAGGL